MRLSPELARRALRRLQGRKTRATTKVAQRQQKQRRQEPRLRKRHVNFPCFTQGPCLTFLYSLQPKLSADDFTNAALPLHVNIMHTPPPIDQVASASKDPGFMGHVVLTPSVFSTRSYGWKGSKKLNVELQNSEDPKKTVWVQLSINAVRVPVVKSPIVSTLTTALDCPRKQACRRGRRGRGVLESSRGGPMIQK